MSEINKTGIVQKIREYQAELKSKAVTEFNQDRGKIGFDDRLEIVNEIAIKIAACDEILKRIGEQKNEK